MDFGDIVEREVTQAPEPPTFKPPNNGGTLKARKWRERKVPKEIKKSFQPSDDGEAPLDEQEKIHLENVQKLAQMSPDEIEREREDIFQQMDPNVLQKLLRRAEMKEEKMEMAGRGEKAKAGTQNESSRELNESSNELKESPKEPLKEVLEPEEDDSGDDSDSDAKPTIHFPRPNVSNNVPKLDVDDEGFLEQLHDTYFPNLEVENDKLEWMKPVSEEEIAEYSPDQQELAASQIRFDFHGKVLSPKASLDLPTNLGLHHHGDAPAAAGYTIKELTHLALSTQQSQRCLAIQTLGRILGRLGKQTKRGMKDRNAQDLISGLQGVIDECRTVDVLHMGLNKDNSPMVQKYATEALWLWSRTRQAS